MPKYEFDAPRWLRNVAEVQSHRAGAGPAMLRENMLKCAVEIERLRGEVRLAQSSLRATAADHASLRAMLSEARDYIMSGPAKGDDVAIVNKICAALGER